MALGIISRGRISLEEVKANARQICTVIRRDGWDVKADLMMREYLRMPKALLEDDQDMNNAWKTYCDSSDYRTRFHCLRWLVERGLLGFSPVARAVDLSALEKDIIGRDDGPLNVLRLHLLAGIARSLDDLKPELVARLEQWASDGVPYGNQWQQPYPRLSLMFKDTGPWLEAECIPTVQPFSFEGDQQFIGRILEARASKSALSFKFEDFCYPCPMDREMERPRVFVCGTAFALPLVVRTQWKLATLLHHDPRSLLKVFDLPESDDNLLDRSLASKLLKEMVMDRGLVRKTSRCLIKALTSALQSSRDRDVSARAVMCLPYYLAHPGVSELINEELMRVLLDLLIRHRGSDVDGDGGSEAGREPGDVDTRQRMTAALLRAIGTVATADYSLSLMAASSQAAMFQCALELLREGDSAHPWLIEGACIAMCGVIDGAVGHFFQLVSLLTVDVMKAIRSALRSLKNAGGLDMGCIQAVEESESRVSVILGNLKRCCTTCGASQGKLKSCSGCRNARYCSRRCQKKDWPRHRQFCTITC